MPQIRDNRFLNAFAMICVKRFSNHLPIEDRFRLEGVSKQFQRTIFKSQNVVSLEFNHFSDDKLKNNKIILKKCLNVNQIKLCDLWRFSQLNTDNPAVEQDQGSKLIDKYNKLVEMIIKNSNNLTDFDFYTDYMSEENRNNFIEKFGSKLISVNLKNSEKPEVFLSSMNVFNIKKLVINRMTTELSHLYFNKLNNFEIKRLREEDLELFELFIERHRNSIKFLSLRTFQLIVKNSFTQQLIKIVTKFNQLIHLSLLTENYNCCHFNDYLKQIALNCKQLRSFECSLQFEHGDQHLLSPLKDLKYLKRLKIDINHYKCGENQEMIMQDHNLLNESSFKLFEGLQNITHLCLELPDGYGELYTERRLQHIDIYLPNLQYFEINGLFEWSEGLTHILGRLSKLETIRMSFDGIECSQATIKLREKCPLLTNFDIFTIYTEYV